MKHFEDLEKTASEADNQYALALAIAKRVKHLKAGAPTLSDVDPHRRPFEAAYSEFASGQVAFSMPTPRSGEARDETSEPTKKGGEDE